MRSPARRLVLLVFFHSYADHRVLHSFPTRRSSDLVPGNRRCAGASPPAGPAGGRARRHPRRRGSRENTVAPPRADRKSTRLNSSHRCISYAVFCLKKKTQTSRKAAKENL